MSLLLLYRNYLQPMPVLSNWHWEYSISTKAHPNSSTDSNYSPNFPIDAADARIIYNRHHRYLKYCQLTPGLLKWHCGSSGDVRNIGSRPSPTRSSEVMAIWLLWKIGCMFYDCTDRAPFYVKIIITGVLTLFVLVPRLILEINLRTKYLNMTAFSQL